MEPVASINLTRHGTNRPVGWQAQLRVDYVVNKVTQTHRGRNEDEVVKAILDQLKGLGVVPNQRQIKQYAKAIAALPKRPG